MAYAALMGESPKLNTGGEPHEESLKALLKYVLTLFPAKNTLRSIGMEWYLYLETFNI
jgi:hypothetical protein